MFWAQGVGRRPGRRLTGADRTRVYSPAISRARSPLRPAAQSLERRGGVRLEQQDLDPILAVSVPLPRKSDRRSTPPRVWTVLELPCVRTHTLAGRTSVTAGLTPYPNPTRRPTSTRLASKDTELVSPNTVYIRERVSGPIIPGEPFR